MSSIRKILAISFAQRYTVLIIQVISTLIIARLLTPREIGIFSIGAAAVAVAHTVRDFGVTTYIIQEPELTVARVRTAFTITLVVAWFLSGLILVAAPFVADFYAEPGVAMVLRVIAFNFFIIPLGSVSLAMLRRDLKFSHLYWITTVSAVVHAGVGVSLAALGFGFMSLAWAGFANIVTTIIGASLAMPQHYFSLPTFSERARVLKFGSRFSIASIVAEIGYAAPDLIVGRMIGVTGVGYFSRAWGFVMLFERTVIDAIRPTILPYFANERRAGQDLKVVYLRAFKYLLGIVWPFLGLMALLAAPLIRLLYGSQWDAAVPLAQVLCLVIAVSITNQLTISTLVVLESVHAVMIVQIVFQSLKILCLIIGATMGLLEVAIGLSLAELAGFILFLVLAYRKIGVPITSLLWSMLHALGLALFTITPVVIFIYILNDILINIFLLSILSLTIGAFAWLAGIYLLTHPLREEINRLLQSFLLTAKTYSKL